MKFCTDNSFVICTYISDSRKYKRRNINYVCLSVYSLGIIHGCYHNLQVKHSTLLEKFHRSNLKKRTESASPWTVNPSDNKIIYTISIQRSSSGSWYITLTSSEHKIHSWSSSIQLMGLSYHAPFHPSLSKILRSYYFNKKQDKFWKLLQLFENNSFGIRYFRYF